VSVEEEEQAEVQKEQTPEKDGAGDMEDGDACQAAEIVYAPYGNQKNKKLKKSEPEDDEDMSPRNAQEGEERPMEEKDISHMRNNY